MTNGKHELVLNKSNEAYNRLSREPINSRQTKDPRQSKTDNWTVDEPQRHKPEDTSEEQNEWAKNARSEAMHMPMMELKRKPRPDDILQPPTRAQQELEQAHDGNGQAGSSTFERNVMKGLEGKRDQTS